MWCSWPKVEFCSPNQFRLLSRPPRRSAASAESHSQTGEARQRTLAKRNAEAREKLPSSPPRVAQPKEPAKPVAAASLPELVRQELAMVSS
jgi:hypothetical protein